jgi:hypothetical protein
MFILPNRTHTHYSCSFFLFVLCRQGGYSAEKVSERGYTSRKVDEEPRRQAPLLGTLRTMIGAKRADLTSQTEVKYVVIKQFIVQVKIPPEACASGSLIGLTSNQRTTIPDRCCAGSGFIRFHQLVFSSTLTRIPPWVQSGWGGDDNELNLHVNLQ